MCGVSTTKRFPEFFFDFRNRMNSKRAGFSLIEVAIALVIFVIGALAVIRIFPTGLSLVEKSGNQQRAANLNRSTLAALRQENSVPEAIHETGAEVFFDGSVSGFAKYNKSLPQPAATPVVRFQDSALDRFKNIQGEKAIVRANASTGYLTTRFSILSNSVTIYEERKIKVEVGTDGTINWPSAIYEDDSTPFGSAPSNGLHFRANYQYIDNSQVWAKEDELLTNDATKVRANSPVVNGMITLVQRVPQIVAVPDEAERRCGIVSGLSSALVGRTVFVDYSTDWEWVLEDLTPAPAELLFKRRILVGDVAQADPTDTRIFRQVELAVPYLANRSSKRFATAIVSDNGIVASWMNAGNLSSAQASRVRFPRVVGNDSTIDDNALREVLRQGKIAFDFTAVPSSAKVRVAYRTQDFWARQVSVAAKSYKRYESATLNNDEQWRNYFVEAATPDRLLFQASEAGKAVIVTFRYNTATGPKLSDQLFTIGNAIEPGVQLGGTHVCELQITPPSDSVAPGVLSILSVRGQSVMSRTAWLTNDQYNQVVQTSMRGAN